MKKNFYSLALALFIASITSTVHAQDDITNIFKAGVTDLNKVANGYLKPAANSFAMGLGSNWYNTADVHKIGGFDLSFGVGVVQVPSTDQFFDLTTLTNLTPDIKGTTQAPSFAGSGDGVILKLMQPEFLSNGQKNPLWNNGNGEIISFNTPQGVSKNIPTASLQLTVGLPFINDVTLRLIPKVSYDGFETSMWGVGVKHNFKRWIPGLKKLPFDAAVMVAYTKMNMNYLFSESARITPEKLVSGGLGVESTSTDYSGQKLNADASALTANIIVSKKLLFFTPYLGFGITRTNFDLTMVGNYPTLGDPRYVSGDLTQTSSYKMKINNLIDPVQISANEVMTNATFGFRLKLAILTFHAQYTMQKYPIASAGFGISIR